MSKMVSWFRSIQAKIEFLIERNLCTNRYAPIQKEKKKKKEMKLGLVSSPLSYTILYHDFLTFIFLNRKFSSFGIYKEMHLNRKHEMRFG